MPGAGGELLVGEARDAMRGWVTAGDEIRHQFTAEGLIKLDIRHNHLEQRWHDLRFCKESTIYSVKEQLHKHGAGSVATIELYLRRGFDTIFCYDDSKTLGSYGAENDMELFVKDTNEHSLAAQGWYENVNLVEKYTMKDEDYDRREKTLRNHFRQERAKDPNFRVFNKGPPGEEKDRPPTPEKVRELYPIDGRCECNPGGRRGAIKFVGTVKNGQGTWIGVALDEPTGMNDGSKAGEKYFECKGDKYGVFSRPENVSVGDFPEEDPFAGLSDGDEI